MLNVPGHHSTAMVVAEVEDTRRWKKGRGADGKKVRKSWGGIPAATLAISDCYRTINLEIEFVTAAERQNSLHKVEALISVLTEFREALAEEQKLYRDRVKAAKS